MTSPSNSWFVPEGDVAVMLNANAGRVSKRMARAVEAACPGAIVFWTRSLDEAQDALEAALESEVSVLFAGGGDGTIIDIANRLIRYRRTPMLGILKLGTGNALASWVGARAVTADLSAWHRGDPARRMSMRLMRSGGESFPFAGLGWDAALLNDYRTVKKRLEGTPLENYSQHLAFYFAAALGRTIPAQLRGSVAQARVEVRRGDAWRVNVHGERVGDILGPGDVLYEGPAHLAAFGTTPFYGYALRMFPHCEVSPRHFQLRLSAMEVPAVLNELHNLWTGTAVHPKLFDFLATSVRIVFDRPVAYQVGGDARGTRTTIDVDLPEIALPVLTFR
jgi:diacylglycerol kinase family enzyme